MRENSKQDENTKPESDLKSKLKDDIDEASWEMLRDHHKRGAVFLVEGIELVDAAAAVARDRVASVKVWLDNGNVKKVEDDLADDYEKSSNEKNFRFIIVQPYVFICPKK